MDIARYYRTTVIGCAVVWLLLGMHLPSLHEVLDHGWRPQGALLVVTVLLLVLATTGLVALLRMPRAR